MATGEKLAREKEAQKPIEIKPTTVAQSTNLSQTNINLIHVVKETSEAQEKVLKGIKNISLANIISKETSGLGLLTVIFKGEDKFKIEGIREEAGHVQDQYKNFVISLLSLNKYMVDSGAGKAKLDGRELAKRMEDYFNSYNTYTEGLMKLRETVEEYTINTKSDYAMAAIDAALTIATVVGVGALVGAGMKAAGGLALKEGAEISAKALAKAVAKNAFKSAINRNALVINVFASSATAGTEVWNQVEMNDAMKKFGENPREGIRSMDAFLSGVESGIAKAGNKNKEEIAKMIKEERIQLNDMAAKLDEPGQKINFWDAAKMFAMTFAVSILIETGLGAAGTAKGLFKAKAPRAKAEPRIEVPAEKATKSKIASLTTQIESGKKAVSNAHVERAKAYLTIGKPEKAMEDLTAAIAKHPGNESAYAARTELRGAQGDIAGAEADAKVYSNYKAAAKTVEQAKSVMGINSTEAIDLLNQAKALNPYSLDAYYYSGSAKFITGDATAGRIDLLRYREIVNSYGLKDKYGVLDPTPGVSIAERLKHVRNQMEHKSESWLWKALNGDIEASERDIVERLTKTKVVGDVAMYKMANEGIEATAMAFDGGKTWLKNGISFELGDASLKIYSKAIVDVVKRTSSMLKGSDISISTIRTGGDEIVVLLTGKGSAAIGNMIEKDVKKEIGTAVAADYNMVPKEMEGIMGAHTCHKTDFTIKLSKKNKLFVEREGRQTTPRQPLNEVETEGEMTLGHLLNEVETEGVRERISSKSSGILSPLLKLKPEPGTRVIRDTPDGYIGGDVMTFRLNFKDEVKGAFAEVAETEGKALTAATRNEVGPSLTNMIGHSVTDGFESIYEERLAEFFRTRASGVEIFKEGAMTFRVNGGEGRIPQNMLRDAADYAAAGLVSQTEKYGVTGCKNFISNSKDRLGLDIAGSLSSETLAKADVEIANRALALARLDSKHLDYALNADCPAEVRELLGKNMPMWVRSYPELKQYLQGNGMMDVNIRKLKGWLNIDNLSLERTEGYLFGELRPY